MNIDHETDAPDRAAAAFRAAFAQHAEDLGFALDQPVIPRTPRGRRFAVGLAAAAVLTVTAGSLAVLKPWEARTTTAATPAVTTSYPAPDAGHKWVSQLGVAVQVPDSWADGLPPSTAWCAGGTNVAQPRLPMVAYGWWMRPIPAIACGNDHPTNTGYYLIFLPHGDDTTVPWGTRYVRTIGGVDVVVVNNAGKDGVADPATDKTAQAILDTARQVANDSNGCASSSPVSDQGFQRPTDAFDVTRLTSVDSITLCQYGVPGPKAATIPMLLAGRTLTGADAASLLTAIKNAPVGSSDTPQTCDANAFTGTAVVVEFRVGDQVHRAYLRSEWCIHNGFDDGTHVRKLAKSYCSPIYTRPLVTYTASSKEAADACLSS